MTGNTKYAIIDIMRICKTSIKQLDYQRRYYQDNKDRIAWEREYLTRIQRETLTITERKELYQNRHK